MDLLLPSVRDAAFRSLVRAVAPSGLPAGLLPCLAVARALRLDGRRPARRLRRRGKNRGDDNADSEDKEEAEKEEEEEENGEGGNKNDHDDNDDDDDDEKEEEGDDEARLPETLAYLRLHAVVAPLPPPPQLSQASLSPSALHKGKERKGPKKQKAEAAQKVAWGMDVKATRQRLAAQGATA